MKRFLIFCALALLPVTAFAKSELRDQEILKSLRKCMARKNCCNIKEREYFKSMRLIRFELEGEAYNVAWFLDNDLLVIVVECPAKSGNFLSFVDPGWTGKAADTSDGPVEEYPRIVKNLRFVLP